MSREEPYMTFMTNEEIVKHIEHLKTLDLPELEKQGMISDWERCLNPLMNKEEVIQIIEDSLDELLDEVGNDYEYNGCNHLVKIIIEKLNQNKDE